MEDVDKIKYVYILTNNYTTKRLHSMSADIHLNYREISCVKSFSKRYIASFKGCSINMDSIYEEQEEYYGKCGELFLTINGIIAIHCTLCEERFKSFQDYNDHILETHFAPDFKAELLEEFVSEEEQIYDPLCDEVFSIETEEFNIKIEKQEELPDVHETCSQFDDSPSEEAETEGYQTEDTTTFIVSKTIPNKAIRPTIRSVNKKPTSTKRQIYKCPYCDFKCGDRANISKHTKRHYLNRPHKCIECGKAFYTRTEVKVHMRVHTGERPYLCNLCGKTFITSGKLSDHQRRHNNKRDMVCPICKISFITPKSLRKHMVIHSDRRDYKCTKCDASFKLPDALTNHMKLHENKRAYKCKFCEARFNQHSGLYSHVKRWHK